MAVQIPNLDNRRYDELLKEALARVPVHTPEWTNFQASDPGVTLVEVFAFLTESLLYRANQIPERNRKKFLSLLGVAARAAASSRGVVVFENKRGPFRNVTLETGLEVRAGQVPYRVEQGLDVLPLEAEVYYRAPVVNPNPKLESYYRHLYASHLAGPAPKRIRMYQTTPLDPVKGVDLTNDTIDKSLWIALLVRPADRPYDKMVDAARREIAGKTLTIGIVPWIENASAVLSAGGAPGTASAKAALAIQIPDVPEGGLLPPDPAGRVARYRDVDASFSGDVTTVPGTVQIPLPGEEQLRLWTNFEPLESGAGEFPPSLEETNRGDRLVTWIRVKATTSASVRISWAGANAAMVNQRARVTGEALPAGTGEPDQSAVLSHTPVIAGSVRVHVTDRSTATEWTEIEDLATAGPEVKASNPAAPPGYKAKANPRVEVFQLSAADGKISFGDGVHGKRPPLDATILANYDYGAGAAGNVAAGAINAGLGLPPGIEVSNPVRTWGGADVEPVVETEKRIPLHLRHRERAVTAEDFEAIVKSAPVETGRVDVIPAYHPNLGSNAPGDAPGAVTLMVIPKNDPDHPESPRPDKLFLDAICRYLDPRRLITTEVVLRGPVYVDVWISAGITVTAGASAAEVRERVRAEVVQFLSPYRWPRGKTIQVPELMAVISKTEGLVSVNEVFLAKGTSGASNTVEIKGLELPRIAGLSIAAGPAVPLAQLRGQPAAPTPGLGEFVPVPVVPEDC